jgi:carbon-monoxide dehydrogenase medium subunit
VIPAQFDYLSPISLSEAIRNLAEAGEDAKILAGGQSLIPVLRVRLSFPTLLVDLGRIADLRGVHDDGTRITIGAMTRHCDVMKDPLIRQYVGLLADATATVADPAVRRRGTFGGALVHADPAGDLAAVALALDAEMLAEGPDGRRAIPAKEFFLGYLETALDPNEILTAVRVPKLEGSWGYRYEKFSRVAQAWATVAVAAAVRMENGSIAEARIGLTNMGPTPLRAESVEATLSGASNLTAVKAAAMLAADGTTPPSDLGATANYRQHLARVLTGRAVAHAAALR